LVTELSEFGRLCQLLRDSFDGPPALDHPHRRSRFRSIVDSPASLRSRESGCPRAKTAFMSSKAFAIVPCVESGSHDLRGFRSPEPSTTNSSHRARETPPPQVAKRRRGGGQARERSERDRWGWWLQGNRREARRPRDRAHRPPTVPSAREKPLPRKSRSDDAGEDRLASEASETGGGGGHQGNRREATRPGDRAHNRYRSSLSALRATTTVLPSCSTTAHATVVMPRMPSGMSAHTTPIEMSTF
jgi:hypothetical protein